jgi:hypothetical protein
MLCIFCYVGMFIVEFDAVAQGGTHMWHMFNLNIYVQRHTDLSLVGIQSIFFEWG